jgi:putative inorganic carbon (HCO3(-)) transporter
MSRTLSGGRFPVFPPTADINRVLFYFQLIASAFLGVLLGISFLLNFPNRLRIMLVAAVVFAPLFVIVKPPRRIVLFALAFVMPLSVGKYFISSDIVKLPVHGVDIQLYDLLAIILIGLFLAHLATNRQAKFHFFASTSLPALAWLITGCFSLVNAKDWQLSSIELITMGKLFIFYLVVANSIHDTSDIKWVISGLLLALGFEAILGIYQGITGRYAGFSFLGEGSEVLRFGLEYGIANRCQGTVCHPNALAMYLNTTIPFAMGLLFSRVRKFYKLLAVVLIGIGVIALIFTLSRGGWLGFVVISCVILVMAIRRGRVRTNTALVLICGALLLSVVTLKTAPNLVTERLTSSDRGSAMSRIPMAKGALAIMRDYPVLGAGLNNYTLYMRFYDPASYLENHGLSVVHNAFLLVGAETGLLGLVAFLCFLVSVMGQAWRSTRLSSNDTFWIVGIGVLSAYAALSVHSLADYALIGCPRLFAQFWFLAAIIPGVISGVGHGMEEPGMS